MWTVTGLHCLPLWLYGCQGGLLVRWLALPPWIQNLGTLLMVSGRLLALPVEVPTEPCVMFGHVTPRDHPASCLCSCGASGHTYDI